ncbi:hypothetical protein ABH940_005746 [Streptacidiphilus sp. BW17]|uniref:hypothetical protein n=1 Tax=Streptacidiphilus sp. BW17 TaxID=3156274 RepID=UPI0035156188
MTTTLTRAAATAALLGALLATAPAATAATRPAPRAAAATPHTRGLLTPVRAAYNGLGSFLNGVSSDLGSGGLLGGSVLDITDLLTATASRVGNAV